MGRATDIYNEDGTPKDPNGLAHDPPAEVSKMLGNATLESVREERTGPKVGRIVADVQPERVHWLWPRRFATGELTILDGDPGLGKSTLLCGLAARLTAGRPMPGEQGSVPYRNGGGLVYVTTEDSVAHTIRPRLDAAGAVLNRCLVVQEVPGKREGDPARVPVIPRDLSSLRKAVEDVAARLLVIDPLMAHLPGDVNSFRDQDVRAALGPLSTFAEEAGVAVVAVRHLNKKTGGPAIYRGGGSIGITGAARVTLLVGTDPQDETRRVLAPVKNNLSPPAPSLAFRLVDGGGDYGAARVEWEGAVDLSAQDLLQSTGGGRASPARNEAEAFLWEMLSDGPRRSAEVHEKREERGIAENTFGRAKREAGVESRQEAPGQPYWMIPPGSEDEKPWASDPQRRPEPQTPSVNKWGSGQNAQNGDLPSKSVRNRGVKDPEPQQRGNGARGGVADGIEAGGEATHPIHGRVTVRTIRSRAVDITDADGTKLTVGPGDLKPVPAAEENSADDTPF
jgi:hypothetical protein